MDTTKKVSYRFDRLGQLCVRLTETIPDGGRSFYYLGIDGAWNLYDPDVEEARPLNNMRYPALASDDPADGL